MDRRTIQELAAISHRLWCESLIKEGWKHGPRYDRKARTHDALVPFEQLSAQDKKHAMIGVEAQELEPALIRAIFYQRGPDREFALDAMRQGRSVAVADPNVPGGRGPLTGAITGWEVDEEGDLALIRVSWEDGQTSEHAPAFRELLRLDEGPSAPPPPRPPGRSR